MKTPHVHAALIKAWADGATIQYWRGALNGAGRWSDCTDNEPVWSATIKYRVKPEPREVVSSWKVADGVPYVTTRGGQEVKWTIDPEANKILSVELVK